MDLREIKLYYDCGFSLLWLHPKSKRPIELKWTSLPDKDWKAIHHAYKPGMNVGVRLGEHSQIDSSFLAVIDVDVKDSSPQAWAEARARLKELFPQLKLKDAPIVLSGRGNGSRHIYVVTKKPCQPQRLAQSPRKVKVHMPSVKPSKSELDALTADQVSKGIRIRAAWEISLMGQRQQVVLPPSIHPDSGKAYKWENAWCPPQLIEPPVVEGKEDDKSREVIEDFKFEEIDLLSANIPDDLYDLIVSGSGSTDRSAELFKCAMRLLRCGFEQRAVLSVLTDKSYYLGQTAFDHAQTKSRRRAAQWLEKFTFRKARKATDPAKDFEGLEIEEAPKKLNGDEAEKQFAELTNSHWKDKIDRGGDSGAPPKNTLKNIVLILENGPGDNIFGYNEFSNRDFYMAKPPWLGHKGKELEDNPDIAAIRLWLATNFRFEPSKDKVIDAVMYLSRKHCFHPVRDYLNSLTWDGIERINTWLKDYAGAVAPEPYLSEVSRKTIVAMVARIFIPGVKFDSMLVLEGKQEIGKSSLAGILAGEWFQDGLPDIHNKDAITNLQGTWVTEVAELAVLKKADSETYKAFFSRGVDRVRNHYGKRWQDWKRQCIFIGTTNNEDYLKDKTGNRRFWPVKMKQVKFAEFKEVRDQLFAEAMWHFKNLGETLWLEGEAKLQAQAIQASRVAEDEQDAMVTQIQTWLKKIDDDVFDLEKFKLADLFSDNGPWPERRTDNWAMQKAGAALSQLGFRKWMSNGQNWWRKKA